MHDDCKLALKKAIETSLPILCEQVGRFSEPHLVWTKRSDGQWRGEYQDRPKLRKVYATVRERLTEAAADFARLFLSKHPAYDGMVGLAGFGSHRIGRSNTYILECALQWLWHRHGAFDCDEASVDAIIEEFAEFVDRPLRSASKPSS